VDSREFKDAIFDQLARVATAFASPKRMELVDLLAQGERTVESLADAANMTVANTSHHLQVLRNAGLVLSRKEGLYVFYRVADESVVGGYRQLRILAESRVAEVRQLSEAFFGEVDGVEPVGFEELLARSKSGEVVVVDVRPTIEFNAGHVPGAISMPLDELSARIAELDPRTGVVAYCRGPYCVLAAIAVRELRAAGLHAQRLGGGPPDWRAAGLALAVGSNMDVVLPNKAVRRRKTMKGSTK
jgi:rhodanese-related sulfurtransferase/DNA-binding transcriptional ArsR family regulator